jgi:hypothetical protein
MVGLLCIAIKPVAGHLLDLCVCWGVAGTEHLKCLWLQALHGMKQSWSVCAGSAVCEQRLVHIIRVAT